MESNTFCDHISDLRGSPICLITRVVQMATLGPDQSERRKFGLDQSESSISPCDLCDVTPIVLTHVTPRNKEHTHTRVESTCLA